MMGLAGCARVLEVPTFVDETIDRGRKALESYVLDVLFNPANREGTRFRGEHLAWHDAESRAALKEDMLSDAHAFAPDAMGWDCYAHGHETTYAGRLGGFYATISFAPGRAPKINLDLD